MYKVLIISIANYDALSEFPVILKQGGVTTIDVFCPKDSWLKKNKYWDNWIENIEDKEGCIQQLRTLILSKEKNYDWVILGDDPTIRFMNEVVNTDELFYKAFPLTKMENREILGSKAGFSHLCSKYALKTPRYLIYDETFDYNEIDMHLDFPILIKPDEGEGGLGILKCEDKATFLENLKKVNYKENLVLQEYIKGYQVGVEVLYKNGELLCYSYSKNLKTVYNEFSFSSKRVLYQHEEIEEELIKIGRSLGINGFGNLAFMFNEANQKHYLIEVDIRPQAWFFYGKFCGSDFSKGIRNYINNDLTLVKPDKAFANKEVVITMFKRDHSRIIFEKDFKGILGWLTNHDHCWRYIPFYDRVLLFATLKFIFKLYKTAVTDKLFKKRVQ
jgi:predicted ATP-grasp superfamily ATP-dependent carboligase